MTDAPEHVRALLESLELDPSTDPELEETPERFANLLREAFSGFDEDPPEMSTFSTEYAGETENDEPVVLTGLSFYSMCVHHLVPFFGAIDLAYLPSRLMTGFGSVGRVVDHVAARPQVQERLVNQIAQHVENQLEPKGLLVRCRARQMCMEMRGAEKRGHLISTASRGVLTSGDVRDGLLATFENEQENP